MNRALLSQLNRILLGALIVGVATLAATFVGGLSNSRQFFFSYLFAFLFWLGLTLGCFCLAMIHLLTGGRWGYPTRRFLEAGYLVFPLMLVLFIPIFFGLHELYPWARPVEVAAEKALQQRHAYSNSAAYIGRQVFFLAVWIGMAVCLRTWSLRQDTTTDAAPSRKARTLSGPGLVIYGLLGTFAAVDWIMSLERHWYSTMFGVIVLIGQILAGYAFSVVLLVLFRNQAPVAAVVNKTHYYQLGNLLLALVMFWTYVSFGQLLIIYSGDLPHELAWYLHRIAGSWRYVIGSVALFHFFLPFFLLLFRAVKLNVPAMFILSAMLFVMHLVDTYWLVMPSLHTDGVSVSWMDFTAPIGIGGLWVSYFLWRLKAAPLLPQTDPGLQFSFVYGH
jgi:hypothetical protein